MQQQFSGFSMEEMKKLSQSDTFRQLMTALQGNNSLETALQQAGRGDMDAVKKAMAALLADPRTARLVQQLQEERHG